MSEQVKNKRGSVGSVWGLTGLPDRQTYGLLTEADFSYKTDISVTFQFLVGVGECYVDFGIWASDTWIYQAVQVSSGKIGVGEEKSNKPRSLTVPILQCFGKYFAKGFSG